MQRSLSCPQGEIPGNMKRFWRFLLRKSLLPDSLTDTRYALFGLGDSGMPFLVNQGRQI